MLAKLVVAAVWWVVLVVVVLAEAVLVGLALGLPGFSAGLLVSGLGDALLAAGIAYLLVPVVAWIAIWGRGNLAPIAFAIAMLALGNLFGTDRLGRVVPVVDRAAARRHGGRPVASLPAGSYVVLALTFVAGIAATIAQLRYADNAQ